MALPQKDFRRVVQQRPGMVIRSGSGPLKLFFRRYKIGIIVAGVLVVAAMIALAIRDGLRRNADRRASALFSKAKTIEEFQAVLAQVPHSYLTFDILINIANLLYGQGDVAEALTYYEKAYQLFPQGFQGASALVAMGMVHAEKKDHAKASVYFQRALELEPLGAKAPEALYQWGHNLWKAGEKVSAKEKYERIVREFAGSPWEREAVLRLREESGQRMVGGNPKKG